MVKAPKVTFAGPGLASTGLSQPSPPRALHVATSPARRWPSWGGMGQEGAERDPTASSCPADPGLGLCRLRRALVSVLLQPRAASSPGTGLRSSVAPACPWP